MKEITILLGKHFLKTTIVGLGGLDTYMKEWFILTQNVNIKEEGRGFYHSVGHYGMQY